MPLEKIKNRLINEEEYGYPNPTLVIQTTRFLADVALLHTDTGNGYVYFYADSDWKNNPTVYIGETDNTIASRHSATHKDKDWLQSLKYPFIGIVSDLASAWGSDMRKAIEALTVYKLDKLDFKIANSTNSTWKDGAKIHKNIKREYAEAVSDFIVEYIITHIGYSTTPAIKDAIATLNGGSIVSKKGELQEMLEVGFIKPQEIYNYSANGKYAHVKATLNIDGNVNFNGQNVSINQAGYIATNTSVSSWEWWATREADGSLKRLWTWRDEYRKSKK